MNRKRFAALAIAVAAILPSAVACTSVPAGSQGVLVDTVGDPKVSGCQGPETLEFHPAADVKTYPSRQISWEATGEKDSEAKPTRVTSNAKEPAELDVPYVITFDMAANCDQLKEFYREFGTKYSDWNGLIRYVVGQPAENVVVTTAQKYTWREIWNDDKVRLEFQNALAAALPGVSKARTNGKEYFVNFQVMVMKPTLISEKLRESINAEQESQAKAKAIESQGVAEANAQKAAAEARTKQAEAEVAQARAEAEKQRAEIAGYPDVESYLKAKSIERGLTIYPSPVIAGAPAR